jgi:hypothetical protein
MTIFEELPALSPVQFFALTWDCPHMKIALKCTSDSRLPSAKDFLDEESFAEMYMGWNEQKILCEVRVKGRTEEDRVELFFDTRDLKTKTHVSKFCHHFSFTPDERQGSYGREITRFRSDDVHRICDPKDLKVDVKSDKDSYVLVIEIPAHCLYGYEPLQFQRLGFTYRISRSDGTPQHFAVSSDEFAIEQNPSLWATIKLAGRK